MQCKLHNNVRLNFPIHRNRSRFESKSLIGIKFSRTREKQKRGNDVAGTECQVHLNVS